MITFHDSPTPLCPLQLREAARVVELPHTTASDGESESGYWQVAQMPPSFMSASAAAQLRAACAVEAAMAYDRFGYS